MLDMSDVIKPINDLVEALQRRHGKAKVEVHLDERSYDMLFDSVRAGDKLPEGPMEVELWCYGTRVVIKKIGAQH